MGILVAVVPCVVGMAATYGRCVLIVGVTMTVVVGVAHMVQRCDRR